MISPMRMKSGTATRVKELVVFQTMSPKERHRPVPDISVTPRIPTKPITVPIASPKTSNDRTSTE